MYALAVEATAVRGRVWALTRGLLALHHDDPADLLESNVFAVDLASGKRLWTRTYNSQDIGPNGAARPRVRLQADPVQLLLPARAAAPQRRRRHRGDRAHHAHRHRH